MYGNWCSRLHKVASLCCSKRNSNTKPPPYWRQEVVFVYQQSKGAPQRNHSFFPCRVAKKGQTTWLHVKVLYYWFDIISSFVCVMLRQTCETTLCHVFHGLAFAKEVITTAVYCRTAHRRCLLAHRATVTALLSESEALYWTFCTYKNRWRKVGFIQPTESHFAA